MLLRNGARLLGNGVEVDHRYTASVLALAPKDRDSLKEVCWRCRRELVLLYLARDSGRATGAVAGPGATSWDLIWRVGLDLFKRIVSYI